MKKNRIVKSGGRGANLQHAAEALDDLRQHIEIGKVKGYGGGAHYEIEDGHVWVDVVLMPSEAPVTCRLTCVAGGPGNGVWMVPPEGAEVLVGFPGGTVENGGIIMCVLSGGSLPYGVSENQIVIVAAKVIIGSPEGQTELLNGVVVAQGIDPFTGQTYGALQNASSVVLAEK